MTIAVVMMAGCGGHDLSGPQGPWRISMGDNWRGEMTLTYDDQHRLIGDWTCGPIGGNAISEPVVGDAPQALQVRLTMFETKMHWGGPLVVQATITENGTLMIGSVVDGFSSSDVAFGGRRF